MKVLTVYDEKLAPIITKLENKKFLDLKPLPENPFKKIKELSRLPEDIKIIYLWGSGFDHGYSFFFDLLNTRTLKINFDAHFDTENSSQLKHLYLSHMYQSAKRHNCECIFFSRREFLRLTDKGMKDIEANDPIKNGISKKTFTIDMDIINWFPAEWLWWEHSEIDLDNLIKYMDDANKLFNGDLMRFDVGGLRQKTSISKDKIKFAVKCYDKVIETGLDIMKT